MDPTEPNPAGAGQQEPNPSVRPADVRETDAAGADGAAASAADPAASAGADRSAAQLNPDGTTRPRRRRRRRRRPTLPATTASSAGDAATATDLPSPIAAADGETSGETSAEAAFAAPNEIATDGTPGRPILRLRLRRRPPRRTHAPGLLPGPADPAASGDGTPIATSDTSGAATARFRAPRRRRRHAPLSAAPAVAGETNAQAGGAIATQAGNAAPGNRPPRRRNRNRHRPAAQTLGEGVATEAQPPRDPAARPRRRGEPQSGEGERGEHGGPRGAARGGPRRGERSAPSDRGPKAPRGRDSTQARARGGAPARPVERKLYSVDAVVDRGFEDVDEDEGARRVHWSIVKRTTADQLSRKTLSIVYVLQRDGADSEYPSLGAARGAVNKTIVHPEKLTRSKAEHAAERAGKK